MVPVKHTEGKLLNLIHGHVHRLNKFRHGVRCGVGGPDVPMERNFFHSLPIRPAKPARKRYCLATSNHAILALQVRHCSACASAAKALAENPFMPVGWSATSKSVLKVDRRVSRLQREHGRHFEGRPYVSQAPVS